MECKVTPNDKRGLGDLVKELRDETTMLLRQEVELAKTEMSEKASTYMRNAAFVGLGGAVAFAGFMFLLFAVSRVLFVVLSDVASETTALWLAPLITGAIVAIVGYVLLQKGLATLKQESPTPERTVQTIKEDKKWLTSKLT